KNAAVKMKKVYENAVKFGAPVVAVFNSKGGEIGEGIELIDAYSDMIENAAKLSGVVPLISIVTGQCSGLNATLCCMSDIVIMTEKAEMFFTPPFIAEDKAENAGKAQFCANAGVAHITVKDEKEAAEKARQLLSLLPLNNLDSPNSFGFEQNDTVISASLKSTDFIKAIADKESIIELNVNFGSASVTALGVLGSETIGFVAIDKKDEKLTAADASKIARFVNFCDAFSIPVVSIIDNEGFEPSMKAEQAGFIRDTAKLAQVYASATTPKISLITGKATGAAFILAGGFKSDMVLVYEDSVTSPISIKAAAGFLELSEDDYIKEHASAEIALQKGYADAVISPAEVREILIKVIENSYNKRVSAPTRKHINLVF
ncbi:MAG: acetyl-CoA carboxylase, partial [Oscillospiraceae bacterium]|nr:acetyl-CoA carboxylase [Oscillospiraceae bacterium]